MHDLTNHPATSGTVDLSPASHPIIVCKGDTVHEKVHVYGRTAGMVNPLEYDLIPLDVRGWVFHAPIVDSGNHITLGEFEIVDDADDPSLVHVHLKADVCETMPVGVHTFAIQGSSPDGERHTFTLGSLTILPRLTR